MGLRRLLFEKRGICIHVITPSACTPCLSSVKGSTSASEHPRDGRRQRNTEAAGEGGTAHALDDRRIGRELQARVASEGLRTPCFWGVDRGQTHKRDRRWILFRSFFLSRLTTSPAAAAAAQRAALPSPTNEDTAGTFAAC